MALSISLAYDEAMKLAWLDLVLLCLAIGYLGWAIAVFVYLFT